MTDTTVSDLEATAERDPDSVNLRALCTHLQSDDYEEQNAAQDVRDRVLQDAEDYHALTQGLVALLDAGEDPRRGAVGTLKRVMRREPSLVTQHLIDEVDADDPRRRGAAISLLGSARAGVVVPHASILFEHLNDPDERVEAHAASAVADLADSFPEIVSPVLSDLRPFLDDRWIPDANGAVTVVYSRDDHEPDPDDGQPSGERLTNSIVRPYGQSLCAIERVARTDPDEVQPVLDRILELIREPPEGRVQLPTILRIARYVARTEPDAIAPALEAVEPLATDHSPAVRNAARELLDYLGKSVQEPDPVEPPEEMATRDGPDADHFEEELSGIDERALKGEADLEDFLGPFLSSDPDARDRAMWGLECGVERYSEELQEYATTLLSFFDEPHECTRSHMPTVINTVVKHRPAAWLPALLDLAKHEDPLVREMATVGLGAVGDARPTLLTGRLAEIERLLDDEPDVRAQALHLLGRVAETDPETVVTYRPRAAAALEHEETSAAGLGYLRGLAESDPHAARPALEPIARLVEEVASEPALSDRDEWEGSSIEVTDDDETCRRALWVCHWIAKADPAAVERVRPEARRVADGPHFGHDAAMDLLATLDRPA